MSTHTWKRKAALPSYSQGKIAADGSFKIQRSGAGPCAHRHSGISRAAKRSGAGARRTRRRGTAGEGIEVTAGAKLSGVRLVFVYGTGSVRGEVKVDREVPEGTLIQVAMRSAPGDARQLNRTTLLDNRLHFVLENIPPGTYELVVQSVTKSGVKPDWASRTTEAECYRDKRD